MTNRVNKFPQIFAFLGVYFAIFLAIGIWKIGGVDVSEVYRMPFINSALFFAFFMVTDPPTSPSRYRDQIWFGIIIAIVSVLINTMIGGLSFLLVGLLVANLWNAWRIKIQSHR